jgi:hypothetical protein
MADTESVRELLPNNLPGFRELRFFVTSGILRHPT